MLRDENFSSRAKVDRYGRKLPKDAGRRELERYYKIEDDNVEDTPSEDDENGDGVVQEELEDLKNGDDDFSSSSEDSSSDDGEQDNAEEDEVFGLLDENGGQDGIPRGQVSSRLAVVNLDWDNIRAADLMAVFSSFVPSSGRILSISIYPSEFGKERMDREEMEGPPKEIFGQSGSRSLQDDQLSSSEEGDREEDQERDEADDEMIKKSILKEDQGLEFDSAKLRRYQLERLRYYYAVLTCSSVSVAEAIYNAVDGAEYLTTANFFDLRYIPDETEFLNDKPRDECTRIPDGYKPNEFVTDALQHSKVKLTWDADDGTRKEAQKRAFSGSRTDIDENDLKAYLGSDSSEEEEAPEALVVDATSATTAHGDDLHPRASEQSKFFKKDAERQKMRALLNLPSEPISSRQSKVEKDAPIGDLQVTFSAGLSSEPNTGSVFENEPERDETTVEKYIRKEKERKARRKDKAKHKTNATDAAVDQAEQPPVSDPPPASEDPTTPDLGFSDPFFTTLSTDKATTTAQRKAEKRQKRERLAADEAASAAKRAELELLMMDDKTSNAAAGEMRHFDMNEIAKAEKASKKRKGKKKQQRLSEREKEALAVKDKDAFEIDVRDERFADVFKRSDFAIDPSHPRFQGTEGMKRLLEEGRRKRTSRIVEEEDGEEGGKRRGVKKARREMDDDRGEDVQRLLKRVKMKTKGR